MEFFAEKLKKSENFARSFCLMAPIVEESTYDLTDTPYPPDDKPIEEMC